MVDKRRDKTAEIPPATIAELLASRRRLAPRQETTDLTGAAQDVRAALEENEQQMLRLVTKAPIPRDELEAQIGPHLEPFSPARRLAVLQAFEVHAYARGIALVEDDVKRQPKNLSMSAEARALRLLAINRLETEMGGLHVVPRVAKPLSTVAAPPDLENLYPFIDGHSPIERILRLSKTERLKGLDFLASLARSGHIDLPVSTVAEPEPLSIPPVSSRSQTRPKVGSSPPPAHEPELRQDAQVPESIPLELEGVASVGAAPAPAPVSVPPQPEQVATLPPAASVPDPEPEPPSSRVSSALAASSRTLRTQAPSTKQGLSPALLIALGGLAMIAIFVGIAALRRGALQPAPTTTTVSTAGAVSPAPPPQPTPQPKPVATTDQPAPKSGAPALESVRLKIKVQPTYARVTVDGVVFTGTDIEVNLAKDAKEHVLKVDAPGYKPHTATFTAEESASFTIALERIPPRP